MIQLLHFLPVLLPLPFLCWSASSSSQQSSQKTLTTSGQASPIASEQGTAAGSGSIAVGKGGTYQEQGSLNLTGQTLTLMDGNAIPDGALYVGSILGALLKGGQVTNIYGNGLNIYYDSDLRANAYLGGGTYSLRGGGYLEPDPGPLPASVWLFLSGLAGLGLWGRGRRARKS